MNEMSVQEFEELLDAVGSDEQRWQAPTRERALALLGRSAEARAALARERVVAGLLDVHLPTLALSPQLSRQLAELPARHPRGVEGWLAWLWRPVGVVVASAALGLIAGWVAPDAASWDGEMPLSAQEEDGDEDLDDWAESAFVELAMGGPTWEEWQ